MVAAPLLSLRREHAEINCTKSESHSPNTANLTSETYLKVTVMMGSSLCICVDMYSTSPKLLRTNTGKIDSSSTIHARRLSSVVI